MAKEPRPSPPGRDPVLPRARRLPGLAALALLLLGACEPGGAVEARDVDAGGRLVARRPARSFTLSFTHSMYGGRVAERYEPVGRRLRRTDVRTEHGGAAEYYARYGEFRRDVDGWVVDAEPIELPALSVRVDATGRPRLDDVDLLGLVPDGHLVELRVVR